MSRTPFLLVGDAPDRPTGLSRILSDVAYRTMAEFGTQLDVRVCGYVPWGGLPKSGVEQDLVEGNQPSLRRWVFNDIRDWGASAIAKAYRQWWGDQPGILLTMWDSSWCFEYLKLPLPVQKWGYFPVDAHNVNGTLSGPPAEAIRGYDRVAAYNLYGSEVLGKVLKAGVQSHSGEVPHLPLGIDGQVFHPGPYDRPSFLDRIPEGATLVGCVATNTPRKDWGMVCQATQYLQRVAGRDVYLWAHVDQPITAAWSLPQLLMDTELEDRVVVTTKMDDPTLAAALAHCAITIAPGRGEGHGYPIVESLCVGTPVVHVDYAGGADILRQAPGWRIQPELFHLVGPYALKRPILSPVVVAQRVDNILGGDPKDIRRKALEMGHAYDWTDVWPRWAEWIRAGLAHVGRPPQRG